MEPKKKLPDVTISTEHYDIISSGSVVLQMGECLDFQIGNLKFIIEFIDEPIANGASREGRIATNIVNSDSLSKTAVVAVSVRDIKTGSVVAERHSSMFVRPASAQKVLTSAAIYNKWGRNYDIKTIIYRFKNDLYIKVLGDPLLTFDDLKKTLESQSLEGVSNVYVDGESIDGQDFGEGWMWDDVASSYVLKYSAFNLDGNLATIKIIPTDMGVQIPAKSVIKIENNLKKGTSDSFEVLYKPWLDSQSVFLEGSVSKEQDLEVPILFPKEYFLSRLKECFPLSVKIGTQKTHQHAIVQTAHRTVFSDVLKEINSNSNNIASESMLKLFAMTQTARQGTTKNGIKLVMDFYRSLGLDVSKISIVDASGVSEYNLVTPDFMTQALFKIQNMRDFISFKQSLAQPGKEGTLKNRLLDVPNIYAKTGTHRGYSSIVGYTDKYVFAIFIQNYKKESKAEAKNLENKLIRTIVK